MLLIINLDELSKSISIYALTCLEQKLQSDESGEWRLRQDFRRSWQIILEYVLTFTAT